MLVSAAAARSASRPPCCRIPCAICSMERSKVIPVWVAGWSARLPKLSETLAGIWTAGPSATAAEQRLATASKAAAAENVRKRGGRDMAESPSLLGHALRAGVTPGASNFALGLLFSRFRCEVSGVRANVIFRVVRMQIDRAESAVLLEVGRTIFQQILAAQLFFD